MENRENDAGVITMDHDDAVDDAVQVLLDYIENTTRDRMQRVLNAKFAVNYSGGKTLGQLVREMDLPPMTEKEDAAATLAGIIHLLPLGRESEVAPIELSDVMSPLFVIHELQDENDTVGERIFIGHNLGKFIDENPEKATLVVKTINTYNNAYKVGFVLTVEKGGDTVGKRETQSPCDQPDEA